MILYEAMIGEAVYLNVDDEAYDAVQTGRLHDFMVKNGLLRFFERRSFSLLEGLLDIDPAKRFDSNEAERHIWFDSLRD